MGQSWSRQLTISNPKHLNSICRTKLEPFKEKIQKKSFCYHEFGIHCELWHSRLYEKPIEMIKSQMSFFQRNSIVIWMNMTICLAKTSSSIRRSSTLRHVIGEISIYFFFYLRRVYFRCVRFFFVVLNSMWMLASVISICNIHLLEFTMNFTLDKQSFSSNEIMKRKHISTLTLHRFYE